MANITRLLDLIEKIKNETPEERAVRTAASIERFRQYDEECAERHRRSRVTPEQLRKTCDWHARND